MPLDVTATSDTTTLIDEGAEQTAPPAGPPPPLLEPPGGDDDGRDERPEPPINNARLAVMLFIGAEAMFFGGLLSSFLVFRIGSTAWPPPFQPRLPLLVTAVNTLVLLSSGYTMHRGVRAIRRESAQGLEDWLAITALLGLIFLSVQGYEWVRLLGFGLTLSSSIYGATFYTLIGCHAAHVFGAVVWLLVVLIMAKKHRFTPGRFVGVHVCGIYWYFVVALWPMLFGLIYLY